MAGLVQKEAKNNNVLDRIARAEEAIRELETAVSNKLFQVVIGEEGGLGNRLYSTGWMSLGWPPANVEKFHVYDGNLKVEGNGFQDVTGGTIYLQNKPSLKGASPADNDVAGLIRALAVNDAGNPIIIADVYFQCTDVTEGSEDGAVRIVTQKDYTDAFVFNLVRDRLGINVLDPDTALHVDGDFKLSGASPRKINVSADGDVNSNLDFDFPDVATSLARVRFFRATNTSGARDVVIYRGDNTNTIDHQFVGNGGYVVGTATDGDRGVGTINAAGDIFKNNSAYTNPDYALEMWVTGGIVVNLHKAGAADYVRLTLAEVEAHIREHYRLPGFDDKPKGVFERGDLLLEKVEELYTHVIEQNKRIVALEARVAALEAGA